MNAEGNGVGRRDFLKGAAAVTAAAVAAPALGQAGPVTSLITASW